MSCPSKRRLETIAIVYRVSDDFTITHASDIYEALGGDRLDANEKIAEAISAERLKQLASHDESISFAVRSVIGSKAAWTR